MSVHPLWRPFVPAFNATRQRERIALRQTDPGELQPHQFSWASDFRLIEQLLRGVVAQHAHSIQHVGSTAVAGLIANPVIDVDLTVHDVADERLYVPRLEAAGFRLIFRDRIAGDEHRQLTLAHPNANLHVGNADALEPRRHELFIGWLKSSPSDRLAYGEAKRSAAAKQGSGRYNDLKAVAVYEIYERAFVADARHAHDPQPLRGVGAPSCQHVTRR